VSLRQLSSDSECGAGLQKVNALKDDDYWGHFLFDIAPLVGLAVRSIAPSIVTLDEAGNRYQYSIRGVSLAQNLDGWDSTT
jgi:hypothetical protein